jgi:hypothetical protein
MFIQLNYIFVDKLFLWLACAANHYVENHKKV